MILNENQYKLIVEFSPNLIWRSGTDGLCDYFNKTWFEFTGRTMDQECGNGWLDGVHPDDLDRCLDTYQTAFAKHEPFEMNYRLKRHDGQWRWINDRGVPCFGEAGVFQGYIGSCMDTTEKVLGEEMRLMAQTDGLTGLMARQFFLQQAHVELERAERFRQNLCIAMIDIDRFKSINDEYGHHIGDEVLRHFARAIRKNVRKFDLVSRYGGDEFIILYANTDLIRANLAMKRLIVELQTPLELPDQLALPVSFSYGFAVVQQDATLESLIQIADKSMYLMKKTSQQL